MILKKLNLCMPLDKHTGREIYVLKTIVAEKRKSIEFMLI